MLLLVLSLLTLFLLMGTMLLVSATRTRAAARAFMAVATDAEASPLLPRALLDEALLILIRGSKDEAVRSQVTESLLGDMYEHGGAAGNRVPFRDEAFDAFGTDDFLTQIDDDCSVSTAAFAAGQNPVADNDADGIPDGVWLDELLPEMMSPEGATLSFRVSYLVLDLDGRINVNAHGGGAAADPVGPASIDASGLPPFAANGWTLIRQGGTRSVYAETSGRRAPRLGPGPGQTLARRGGSAATLRLDRNAPRPATLTGTPSQNPFTLGELERVLRPFDPDCSTLPPRLAAMLEDLEGSARRLLTTDSWDVTSKTGPAAGNDRQLRFDLTSSPGNKAAFASALFAAISPDAIAGGSLETAQWVANVAEFRDALSAAPSAPQPLTIGGHTVTGIKPSDLQAAGGAWVGTAGFVSSGELAGIPRGNKTQIEAILDGDQPGPLVSLVESRPAIFEAVMVPSRFTATIAQDPNREPGRVNVNTCSVAIWEAVCGLNPPPRPDRPMRMLWEVLRPTAFRGNPAFPAPDIRGLDRDFANRLASVATVRSNVFAVWISLEIVNSAVAAGPPTCHRLFAIVDRSIPVEYLAGENKDVRQTVRLVRFLN
jgi:hypothetical protein